MSRLRLLCGDCRRGRLVPVRTGPTARSWQHLPDCCQPSCAAAHWSRQKPCWPGTAVGWPASGPTRVVQADSPTAHKLGHPQRGAPPCGMPPARRPVTSPISLAPSASSRFRRVLQADGDGLRDAIAGACRPGMTGDGSREGPGCGVRGAGTGARSGRLRAGRGSPSPAVVAGDRAGTRRQAPERRVRVTAGVRG